MAVADEQGFSRAAEKLFLTQPAISMQIKGLEEEMDTPLFDRVGKRVVLTQAGKVLLQSARNIFKEITASTEEIDDLKGLKTGSLTIACSDTLSRYYLAEKIGQFLSAHSAIEINLLNKTTPEITDLVVDLHIDLGFVILPVQFPRLKVTRVITYRELAVCSTDHPLAEQSSIDLRQLADFPLLLLDPMTKSRVLLERAFHQQGISVQRRLELGSVEVQKALAQIGLGVAIVPDFSVTDDDLHSVDIPQLPDREIGVICREDRQLPATATAFMNLL